MTKPTDRESGRTRWFDVVLIIIVSAGIVVAIGLVIWFPAFLLFYGRS